MATKDKTVKIDDLKVVGETDTDKFEKEVIKSAEEAKKAKKATPKKTATKSTKSTGEAKKTATKSTVKKEATKKAEPKTAKTEEKAVENKETTKKTKTTTTKKSAKAEKDVEEPKEKAVKTTKTTKAKKNEEKPKEEKKPAVEKKTTTKRTVADSKKKETKTTEKKKTASKKVVEVEETKSTAEAVAEAISKKKTTKTADKKEVKPKTEKTSKVKGKVEPVEKKVETPKTMITPANGIDLLVSFDTTGSMYPVLSQVRREVSKLVNELYDTVHDIRIGIIAHGDYCDAKHPYTIRIMDFTNDIKEITKFIEGTDATYGGDADECYELVLNQARTTVNWGAKRNKVFVLIGDANPHGVNYPDNKNKIDWKNEAGLLGDMGVKIFAVHALSYYRSSSKAFYSEIANKTQGTYLTLDQFSEVTDLIRATCYSQYSEEQLNDFVSIIRDNGKLSNSLARNINRLYGREVIEGIPEDYTPARTKKTGTSRVKTDDTLVQADGLVPIAPGRFQTMEVEADCDIRRFVEDNGIHFVKGHAFYELTKAETVQQYKEVILQDRKTGEMFNGSQVREYLGLKPQIAAGGDHEKLHKDDAKEFRIFVQSTSVNRKLIGGTVMLYEIADE